MSESTNTTGPVYVICYDQTDKPDEMEAVYIQTEPDRTNMSDEPKSEGWLGTTNGLHAYAHGEFETLEEAATFVEEKWPTAVERNDLSDVRRYEYDADEVETAVRVLAVYDVHHVTTGDIVSFDEDADEPYDALSNLPAEAFIVCSDMGTNEIKIPASVIEAFGMFDADEIADHLTEDGDIKTASTHKGYGAIEEAIKNFESKFVAALRTVYPCVQVINSDKLDAYYILATNEPAND